MTSTTLSNKRRFAVIVKNQIRQQHIWIILVPIAVLLASALCIANGVSTVDGVLIFTADGTGESKGIISQFVINDVGILSSCFLMGIYLIMSPNAYSHLYSRRKSDFYEAQPITRCELYFSRTICAGIMAALAFLCELAVTAVAYCCNIDREKSMNMGYSVKFFVVCAVVSIAFYTIVQMCAVTSGRRWQYWLLSFGMLAVVPFGVYSLLIMPSMLMPGASSTLGNYNILVSPFLALIASSQHSIRFRYAILSMIVFAIIIFALGLWIYKKRQSENAGKSISDKILITLFALGAVPSSFLFMFIFSIKPSNYPVLLAGGIGCTAVVLTIISLIFYRKSFNRSFWLTCAVATVITSAYVATLSTGGLGYASNVPKAEDVKSASVCFDRYIDTSVLDSFLGGGYDEQIDNSQYPSNTFTSKDSINRVLKVQQRYINYFNSQPISSYAYKTAIVYELNDGSKIKRYYWCHDNVPYSSNLFAGDEYKKNSDFVKAGQDNTLCIAYLPDVGDSINLDKDRYYNDIVDNFESMNEDDFDTVYYSNIDYYLSTASYYFYFLSDNASEKDRNRFKSMSYDQIVDYYSQLSSDDASPIKCVTISMILKNQSLIDKLAADGVINKNIQTKDIKPENIKNIHYARIMYYDDEKLYNIGIDDYTGTYNTPSFLGQDILSRDFADNTSPYFDSSDDKKVIASVLKTVDDKKNQFDLLKASGNKGYTVYFEMNDGSYSKILFAKGVNNGDDLV